jgi:hypothetical protein
VFAALWWPLSVFFANPKTIRLYSVLGALTIAAFLTFENLHSSPFSPWALLTYPPVFMWPVGVLLRCKLGRLGTALLCSSAGILYYAVLNITVFRGYPWAIYPAYALIWWPLALAFAKRGRVLTFSVLGSLLSAALFIAPNLYASPQPIWAVYPIFALAWWPLAVYYFDYRRTNVDSLPATEQRK